MAVRSPTGFGYADSPNFTAQHAQAMAARSTARVGAKTITDKAGRPMPRYAAVFDGKKLVVVSDCLLHPKYQALRPPRSEKAGCLCAEIWKQQGERD